MHFFLYIYYIINTNIYKIKRILILVVALISFSAVNSQTSVIKANPLGLAVGVANAGYEFTMGEKNSLTVSGTYYKVSDISGIGAGSYSVIVTDSLNKKDTAYFTVTQPGSLSISAAVDTNITCFGDSNGVATATSGWFGRRLMKTH